MFGGGGVLGKQKSQLERRRGPKRITHGTHAPLSLTKCLVWLPWIRFQSPLFTRAPVSLFIISSSGGGVGEEQQTHTQRGK
jgi:hypothetical protein